MTNQKTLKDLKAEYKKQLNVVAESHGKDRDAAKRVRDEILTQINNHPETKYCLI